MNPYRHFYLFAKGHYGQCELKKAVLILQSNYTGCAVDHLTLKDCISTLYPEIFRILTENDFVYFLNSLLFIEDSDITPEEKILLYFFRVIRNKKIEDLGEIDESLLKKLQEEKD